MTTTTTPLPSTHPLCVGARGCGRAWADQVALRERAPAWCELTSEDCHYLRGLAPIVWQRIGGCSQQLEDEARRAYAKRVAQRVHRGEIQYV